MKFALGLSIGFFAQGAMLLAAGLVFSTGGSQFWAGVGVGAVVMALFVSTAMIGVYYFFRQQQQAFERSLETATEDVEDVDNVDDGDDKDGAYRPAAVEVLEDLLRNYRPVTPPLRVSRARNRARRV